MVLNGELTEILKSVVYTSDCVNITPFSQNSIQNDSGFLMDDDIEVVDTDTENEAVPEVISMLEIS